ncbi:exocyst complex component EXO70B1-like [Populus alba x Populus x berolinensis]|uniref:Exocyst subunit Exo70 family protein n=1 Tax=Populus alba x Populus x berolinensis TaxID=444605 RepID=A0AAD6Q1U9_9ROSI|nr:exocyst complex component EXO70B1-like [Populus alba x Populus x berolinensis]
MAAENGEEKLIAVARHIAKTLGNNESMADDILQIFSKFDGRFSREKLADKLTTAGQEEDPRALDHTIKSLERQISQYVAADHPIWSDSADSSAFLDCVDELISTVRGLSASSSAGAYLARAEDLLQQTMFRLEEEFRLLIERGGESFETTRSYNNDDHDYSDSEIPVAQRLSNYDVIIDALPSGIINDLHEIAKRMVVSGSGKECSHVYSSFRREFLEESLSRLGLGKLSNEEVQKMQWQELEDEIDKWIKAANVSLRILFPSERRLCDRVFYGLGSGSDLSFMEVCRGAVVQILNFADAIAIGSRSPERLFKVLDLFETMRDLMPEFEFNFSDQYCLVLRNDALGIWKRLGEAIRGIFMELENLIRRDPAKAPVPRGGLHPITRYVMNYLRAACRSRESLELVFEESVNVVPSKDSTLSSLSVQMTWIMELLESNLEVKAKIYGDTALCSVFLMNNERYIVQKVKDSELGLLLGDDWIRKHTAKIKQYLSSYQRSSWNKLLGVLRADSSPVAANVGGKSMSMKDRIKAFNSQFEEIYKSHSQWIIFDEQLRNELRNSLYNLVMPAYRNFIARFQNAPDVGRHADRYIKYTLEDIGTQINELFEGVNGSAGGRK